MITLALSLTLFALAYGCRRWALWVVSVLGLGPWSAGAVGGALMVGAFLTPIALVGRTFRSFDSGLLAALVFALVLAASGRKLVVERAPERPPQGIWIAFLAVLALTVAVYAYVAVTYQIHDEHALFGHKSMVEQLRYGVYPVHYAPQPEYEARYHYGFDVLAGALARAYGVSSDFAIDLVTLLMVVLMSWTAAALAVEAGALRSAAVAAAAVHFGAGLAFVALLGVPGRHPRCLVQYHHPSCGVELFPTQFLNVFQHPVSVGVPLVLAWILLAPKLLQIEGLTRARVALVSFLVLQGLALGQLVYFALGCLAVLAAVPFWLKRPYPLRALGYLVGLLALSLVVAWLAGGMLAANPTVDPGAMGLRRTLGFPPKVGPGGIFWHHLVNLGLPFLLLPLFAWVGLRHKKPVVLILTAFSVGGILVAHLFDYARSWDIVKFPSAASFLGSMAYVVVVDAWLTEKLFPWAWLRRLGLGLLMGSGLLAAAWVVWPLPGDLRLYDQGRWVGDPLVRQAILWLRTHDYDQKTLVFAQGNVAQELSVFGGLSVVADDTDYWYLGIKSDIIHEQRRLAERLKVALDPEAVEKLKVKWLVFSDEELNNLGSQARSALNNPKLWAVAAEIPGENQGRRRRIWRRVGPE